jgi:hypothetical protein
MSKEFRSGTAFNPLNIRYVNGERADLNKPPNREDFNTQEEYQERMDWHLQDLRDQYIER